MLVVSNLQQSSSPGAVGTNADGPGSPGQENLQCCSHTGKPINRRLSRVASPSSPYLGALAGIQLHSPSSSGHKRAPSNLGKRSPDMTYSSCSASKYQCRSRGQDASDKPAEPLLELCNHDHEHWKAGDEVDQVAVLPPQHPDQHRASRDQAADAAGHSPTSQTATCMPLTHIWECHTPGTMQPPGQGCLWPATVEDTPQAAGAQGGGDLDMQTADVDATSTCVEVAAQLKAKDMDCCPGEQGGSTISHTDMECC